MSDLPELRECVLEILKSLSERPRCLKLRVGEASIELEWPDIALAYAGLDLAAAGVVGDPARIEAGPAGAAASSGVAARAVPVSASSCAAAPLAPAANLVCAPCVGTFYRASEPGAAPFVTEGDLVRPGQQVAIVEAMKLMLPVEATQVGWITKILKANGVPVEYGEPLMELAPPGQANGRTEVHPDGQAE